MTKEERREWNAAYYKKHRKTILADRAASYPSRKKVMAERWQNYYLEHKEELARKSKERYDANPEKVKQDREKRAKYHAEYYSKNREILCSKDLARKKLHPERRKQYEKNNREKFRGYGHKRRARQHEAIIGDVKLIEKWERSVRSKPFAVCYWCRTAVSSKLIHMDHIKALSKGGAHDVSNLCVSCGPCNQSKHAKDLTVWNSMISEPVLL